MIYKPVEYTRKKIKIFRKMGNFSLNFTNQDNFSTITDDVAIN